MYIIHGSDQKKRLLEAAIMANLQKFPEHKNQSNRNFLVKNYF